MLISTKRNYLIIIATFFASIGAINWGLVGMFDFNLVTFIFDKISGLTHFIYILVGMSGLYLLLFLVINLKPFAVINRK